MGGGSACLKEMRCYFGISLFMSTSAKAAGWIDSGGKYDKNECVCLLFT